MNMEKYPSNTQLPPPTENAPHPLHEEMDLIDLKEVVHKVWVERKWIAKCCAGALLVGLIVAFSIPREYTSSATIAPETNGKGGGGGNLSSLAAMAGISLGGNSGGDAIQPDLYPDIVSSTPFLVSLFDVPVTHPNGKDTLSLYEYMESHQRTPWWNSILSLPSKLVGGLVSIFTSPSDGEEKLSLDPTRLSPEQTAVMQRIKSCIFVSVDRKTFITEISVKTQNPSVAATLADTVLRRLQTYITEYRTNKARQDFNFQQTLFERKKQEYEQAQERYALFVDANRNIIQQSYRVEQERLENEMRLAYNMYTAVAQQLQVAEAKVQEITPVYTTIQPATVPLHPTAPRKAMILIATLFLAAVGSVAWVAFGRDFLANLKQS